MDENKNTYLLNIVCLIHCIKHSFRKIIYVLIIGIFYILDKILIHINKLM